jgi:hypothetical protein
MKIRHRLIYYETIIYMPPSNQVIKKKKSKRKSKKTTTRGGIKLVNNIHINSKSGTRSKTQRRGGVGGSVAPSGASTISHVPLVMNVPAPDSTQRETKWMHALEDIQSDNIALRMQLDEFVKNQGVGSAPNPGDKNPFQKHPSKANFEEEGMQGELLKRSKSSPPVLPDPPEASARPKRGRPRKSGVQPATPVDDPLPSYADPEPLQERRVRDITSFFESKK